MIPRSKGHKMYDTKVQKVIKCVFTHIFMTLGPAKHENVAIFHRKMSEIRMFLGFRECTARRNP